MSLIPDILIMTLIGAMLMLALKVVRDLCLHPHLNLSLSRNILINRYLPPPISDAHYLYKINYLEVREK